MIIGGQILKWAKNLKSIIDKNTPGNCPVCNSINTDYSVHIIDDKTNMGYGVIWCNDCKNAFHISRIKVSPNMKNGLIPEELNFLWVSCQQIYILLKCTLASERHCDWLIYGKAKLKI